jgi:D-arabinose 1-dehydrogenase-like Zn-dependent alcohol dehydrogenase
VRGVAFGGDRTIEFVEVPDPTPGPFEVVLEMKASGICGSDIHQYRSAKGSLSDTGPIIVGHEPCGIVAAVGSSVAPWEAKAGDRVMVHHYWGCNTCRFCRIGWRQMCARQAPVVYGANAHGGHAPYLKVPAATLVSLPPELSFEAGAAIACGTGTAFAALRRLGVTGGDRVAIYGQGPVGLAATQLAASMGAHVVAVDIAAGRLVLARSMGAWSLVDSSVTDPVAAIKNLTGGAGVDSALDASGATQARSQALASVRPWGSLALVGVGGEFEPNLLSWLRTQVNVFPSWTFSTTGQAECAEFAVTHGVAVDAIFTERWRLDQADEAYKMADGQAAGKGVLVEF